MEGIQLASGIVNLIQENFQILVDHLIYLEAVQDEVKAQITKLISDSQQKDACFQTLAVQFNNAKFVATIFQDLEFKIINLESFDGDRLKLLDFLAKCQFKFLDQPSRFSIEKSKIIYTEVLLDKEAFS
jgi:hypothetical protein